MISVIVPSFNREKSLKEAILSICNQSYKNFEIIVVNDCGIDTRSIIDEIKTKNKININYIYLNKNKGISAVRNIGIKNAKGKFIAFLDDDDIFYPNHLETLINGLENNPSYKIAYTWAKVFEYKNGRKKETNPFDCNFSKDHILIENYIPINSVLIKKEVFTKEGFWFNEDLSHLEDYDLWLRLIKKYDFLCIPEYTCEVRKIDNSLSTQYIKMFKNKLLIYNKYPISKNDNSLLYYQRAKNYDHCENTIFLLEKVTKNEKLDKVSIIIPCNNNIDYTKKILEIIDKKTIYKEKEIILVNSFTSPKFIINLKESLLNFENLISHCDINFFFTKENYNLTKLLNKGVEMSKGSLIAFILNAFPEFSWLTSLIKFYKKFSDCGLIAGKTLTDKNIKINRSFKKFIKIFNINQKHIELNIQKLDMVYSKILLFSKKDFLKINKLNENSDEITSILQLSIEMKKINKSIYFNPFSECYF